MKDDFRRSLRIDVALSPIALELLAPSLAFTTTIVVDVIRATTTIAVLFEHGCRRVLVAPDISAARAAKLRHPNALLAGEVNGEAPPGFDLGNSPAEVIAHAVEGRNVIFATTNGTQALRACSNSRATYAGSLRNARAVTAAALARTLNSGGPTSHASGHVTRPAHVESAPTEPTVTQHHADIVVVCAGRGRLPAYDDTVCAGYLCRELAAQARDMGYVAKLDEGARIAEATLQGAFTSGTLWEALSQSDAARAIAAIGLSGDLDWCVATNGGASIPAVTGLDQDGLLVIENTTPATA